MGRAISISLIALGASTAHAFVGNVAAQTACNTFPADAHALICLSDVSFAVCQGGGEIEQFVPPRMHCEKGQPGVPKDALVAGDATATRAFALYSHAATATDGLVGAATPSATTSTVATDSAASAADSSAGSSAAAVTDAAASAADSSAGSSTAAAVSST